MRSLAWRSPLQLLVLSLQLQQYLPASRCAGMVQARAAADLSNISVYVVSCWT